MTTYVYEGQAFSPGDEIRCMLADDEFAGMTGKVVSVKTGGCLLSMNNGKSLMLHPTGIRKVRG